MCPPMLAHWRQLANTIELVLPLANESPQPKWQIHRSSLFVHSSWKSVIRYIGATWWIRLKLCTMVLPCEYDWTCASSKSRNPNGKSIGSVVSAQLTTENPHTLQWATLSPKLPLLMGDLDPHLIHDSLGQPEPIIQTASRSVQLFSHRWPQSFPILYNGTPLSSSKLPLPMGDLDPHTIHGSKQHLDQFGHFCRAH